MTKVERLAAIFGIAFAVIYAPTMDFNWTLATYHPIQGIWQLGRAPPLGGGSPAMYWYGWTAMTLVLGGVLSYLATFLPEHVTKKIPLTVAWLLPWLASFWNVFNDSTLDFADQRWAEDPILSSKDVEDRN